MKLLSLERCVSISSTEFERKYVRHNKPLIITGMMDNWRAIKWDVNYLHEVLGDVVVDITLKQDRKSKKKMKFSEFLMLALSPAEESGRPCLENFPIFDQAPEMRKHVKSKRLFSKKKYNLVVEGAFIGGVDSSIPIHKDSADNLLSVIIGRSFIVLVPPEEECNISHPSVIPTIEVTNIGGNPMFADINGIYFINLQPGEMIFIPKGWVHYTHYLDFSVTVSCWAKFIPQ